MESGRVQTPPVDLLLAIFRCPRCRGRLTVDESSDVATCASCGRELGAISAVLDFVEDAARADERAYYEAEYGGRASAPAKRPLAELDRFWSHPGKPVNRALLRRLGDLRGKRVLLVGNGGSPLELRFLAERPELLIVSDLAAAGVDRLRGEFDLSEHRERVTFAAIDALDLPIADGSIDLVYGKAIVHHLPDRERFLAEVVRVLRPGGRAVFMDDGYVAAWQVAKRSVLKPLFAYSHRRYPRSPEDVRETQQGGFREGELARTIEGLGAAPQFERQGLLYHLWRRATLVLLPPRLRDLGEHPAISRPLVALDRRLLRYRAARRNAFRLLWGLEKPAAGPGATRRVNGSRSSRRRIAFIDYFPIHYRIGLYEEIARRMDADFYFFADEQERWHNKEISAIWDGDFRRIELPKRRIAGQAVMPGIARALDGDRYDAVVKNLNGRLMLPLTYYTARMRGLGFVLWTGVWHHLDSGFHRRTRRLTEGLYRGADAVVAYGDHVKRHLTEVPGVDPAKVFVAGQAVNPGRFEAVEPRRDGPPDILFIGQFKEYKGIDTLLEAFDRLDGTGARLRMVGNGPLEDRVQAAADRNPALEVIGHVPQDDLPHELSRARCLVLPSVTTPMDREPWGLVANEAMHAGLPVVASSAVGAAAGGLVRDGRNGLVVPERDPEALAEALRAMVASPELAAELGDQARQDAREFDYPRMANAFEAAVERAVAVRSRG